MSNGRKRRHYRSARKQISRNTETGIFIPDEIRAPVIIILVLALLFAFLKGVWAGGVLARREKW